MWLVVNATLLYKKQDHIEIAGTVIQNKSYGAKK